MFYMSYMSSHGLKIYTKGAYSGVIILRCPPHSILGYRAGISLKMAEIVLTKHRGKPFGGNSEIQRGSQPETKTRHIYILYTVL